MGCFVGVTHKNFPFIGKEFAPRELKTNDELIKKQIDKWNDKDNNDLIAKVFKKIKLNQNISIKDVRELFGESYCDLTLNKKKRKWYLVFDKNETEYFLTKEALEYIQKENNIVEI